MRVGALIQWIAPRCRPRTAPSNIISRIDLICTSSVLLAGDNLKYIFIVASSKLNVTLNYIARLNKQSTDACIGTYRHIYEEAYIARKLVAFNGNKYNNATLIHNNVSDTRKMCETIFVGTVL